MSKIKTYLKRLGLALLGMDQEYADLYAFNKKYKLLYFFEPGLLSLRKHEERVKYLLEEVTEFAEASTLEEAADALIDIVYIAKGTAVMMGLPWEKLWADVQRANMAKVLKATTRSPVDVTKPEGWVPPQGAAILNAHNPMFDAKVERSAIFDGILREDLVIRNKERAINAPLRSQA